MLSEEGYNTNSGVCHLIKLPPDAKNICTKKLLNVAKTGDFTRTWVHLTC